MENGDERARTRRVLVRFKRRLPGLAIISFLSMLLASSVSAQTNSDSWMQWFGSARAHGQLEINGSLLSPSLGGSSNITPTAKANDAARRGDKRGESKVAATQPEANLGAKKAGSAVLVNIDKTNQKMTVFLDGIKKYEWPVSTGKAGYSTPSGTYTATSMNEIWYSKQWDNAPMPHSIFFMKDGHAIHGSNDVKNLGHPASHGCVRVAPENAAALFALVAKNGMQNTQVVLTGTTPGGEFKIANKVASPAGGTRHSQSDLSGSQSGDNDYAQPQTRSGFFERLFGGGSYNSQGYSGQPRAFY